MTKQINTIAVNLMNTNLNSQQQGSLQKKKFVESGIMADGNDGLKEQDLSIKNHSFGELGDLREQQQTLLLIKKQESENNNTENNSGNQTVPSMNPFSADNHYFIPMHHLNSSRLTTSNLPPPLMPTSHASPTHHFSLDPSLTTHHFSLDPSNDEASRKRELRLLKNKEAAKECRRKKKEYVRCLENRVNLLENQNKTLIEELKSLKELYCQKDVQS